MRPLDDLLSSLRSPGGLPGMPSSSPGRLRPLDAFGANPGALDAFFHVPANLPEGAPLVVVLHGCTQTAAGYDQGSGWSGLADEQGFAALFPQQVRGNNPNLCFNWFRPGDARRGRGEVESIRQMVALMVSEHDLDQRRVFVTGLSAGGAMAAALLAVYPDVFAGGAVIAGLPFATANSIPEALDRMRGSGLPTRAELGALAGSAGADTASVPTLSVWHGTADATVAPANADAIVAQWTALHDLPSAPARTESVDGHRRSVWTDGEGRAVIERFDIAGLGHGTPLATRGEDGCGAAAPYMLEAGINSTRRIADFWGILMGTPGIARKPAVAVPPQPAAIRLPMTGRLVRLRPRQVEASPPSGVAAVIDKALRSAGLLR